MSAVTWPLQRAVLLRAPIPVWAAVLRRRRWSFSAFRSRTRDGPQGAAALRDSDAAYTRAPGTNARTFAAETMAVGRRDRALQCAADARRRVAKRTVSWLARARLGLDCHEFSSASSRACTRVRLMGTAAARALCAPHSRPPATHRRRPRVGRPGFPLSGWPQTFDLPVGGTSFKALVQKGPHPCQAPHEHPPKPYQICPVQH